MENMLLHPYRDNNRKEDEKFAWDFCNAVQQQQLAEVVSSTDSWEKLLEWYWADRSINNLFMMEHDCEPTIDMMKQMLACDKPLCTQAYILYPATTALPNNVFGHRWVDDKGNINFHREHDTPEFTDYGGFGFIKFGIKARETIKNEWVRDSRMNWWNLDYIVGDWFHKFGLKFHIHYPLMTHHHRSQKNALQGV